ncbi:MAG: hypothetical protein ABI882_09160 [Acidobacteriota bacterium]
MAFAVMLALDMILVRQASLFEVEVLHELGPDGLARGLAFVSAKR